MNSVSKAILIAVGALLALIAIGLIAANLYIQSPPAQARIQAGLSKALHLPLKITNTSISPWGALRINGIVIPADAVNFMEAASFRARYRMLPLLAGRLEVSSITLSAPKIVWVQSADGKWKLPEPEQAAAISEKAASVAEQKSESAGKSAPPSTEKTAAKKREPGFSVSVGRIDIKDGSIELLDSKKRRLAYFTGVNIRGSLKSIERMEGAAQIARATWRDTLALENVHATFTRTETTLEIPDLTATLGGGPVRGRYRSTAGADADSNYEAALQFENADLDQIAVEAGGQPKQAAGKASGRLDLRGKAKNQGRPEGSGKVTVRDGRLRQLDLFQTIGQALGIRELADFHLTDAHADFHVAGEKIYVDELVLAASDLLINATGTIRSDKKVALDAQLAVEESMIKQLPSVVRDSFSTTNNGRRAIAFTVSGSTDKLKTNLLDKLIGQKITAQFDDLLSSLFGKKNEKKKEEEEKKKAEKERKKREKAQAALMTTPTPTLAPAAPVTPIIPKSAAPLATPDPAAVPVQ